MKINHWKSRLAMLLLGLLVIYASFSTNLTEKLTSIVFFIVGGLIFLISLDGVRWKYELHS